MREGILETELRHGGTATVAIHEDDAATGERVEGVTCWMLAADKFIPAETRVTVATIGTKTRIVEAADVRCDKCGGRDQCR